MKYLYITIFVLISTLEAKAINSTVKSCSIYYFDAGNLALLKTKDR